MSVPLGWSREDHRTAEDLEPVEGPPSVAEITSLSTLDVITAALGESSGDGGGQGDAPDDAPAHGDDSASPTDDARAGEPSVAAVMAATLANPPRVAHVGHDDEIVPGEVTEDDVTEEAVDGGTQLVLAAAARLARRARPVPASLDDQAQ